MSEKVKCLNCGKKFSFITLAGSMPGRIKCSKCKTLHSYKNVGVIAFVFFLLYLSGIPLVSYLSDLAATVENGVYDKGLLSSIVYLGGFVGIFYALGSLYIFLIEKKSTIQLKNT